MPTVTLKVSDADRELWVEAAGQEEISLSEWLRRAATEKLSRNMLGSPVGELSAKEIESVSGAPVEEVVITPEQQGEELVEAWGEPVSEELIAEASLELTQARELTREIVAELNQRELASGEGQGSQPPPEAVRTTGSSSDASLPTERDLEEANKIAEMLGHSASSPQTEQASEEIRKESDSEQVGVEEVAKARASSEQMEANTSASPSTGSATSTPTPAEAGEEDVGASPTGESAEAPSTSPAPSAPSAPASATDADALLKKAREMLGARKDFKPDFKPEKGKKKR